MNIVTAAKENMDTMCKGTLKETHKGIFKINQEAQEQEHRERPTKYNRKRSRIHRKK